MIGKRSLQNIRVNYRINGGRVRTDPVHEWEGGERYGDTNDDYYAEFRATIDANVGDSVQVWFSGRNVVRPDRSIVAQTPPFTYTVHNDIDGRVLILAAEDVTGLSPVQGVTAAQFADEYASSLTAAGYTSDVYDFDVMGRKAPHHLGVLSHYDAVVWETGNDIILRAPGQVGGTTAEAALDIELAVRDYLNEGGKLLVAGKYALFAQAANGAYYYNPFQPPECTTPDTYPCLPVLNDFQQYWLGAYANISDGGTDVNGDPYLLVGTEDEFDGVTGDLNAPGSAENQDHTALLLATSSFLPPEQFPQFASAAPLDWDIPGGPFDPHTGTWYVYSQLGDVTYKRLTRTIDLTGATSGNLSFWTSYDTEADWDFVFVEAHEVGTDQWTTLPDANGHTQQSTGDSCPEGWVDELHPFLAHYMNDACEPTGTDRRLARRVRRVAGLGAVVDRSGGLRRQAGRGLDHLHQRLGDPGSRGLPRRRHRVGQRGGRRRDLLRGRPGRLGGRPDHRRVQWPTETTGSGPSSGSRKGRPRRPRTRCTPGSGSRGWRRPNATTSWPERWPTCSPPDRDRFPRLSR